jgi:hypothetical protein
VSRLPLPKRYQGTQLCERVHGDGRTGGKLTLCITGAKYGFTGWLYPDARYPITPGADRLPVVTGDARTPEQAMKNAKKFLEKVATKRS